jgi:5'-3' exonuclease
MKGEYVTEDTFTKQYKMSPKQHIDVGALMGDKSDNIFGIPGWGEVTALKAIQEHGSWENVISHLEEKHKDLIQKHPPLTTDDSSLYNKLNPVYQGSAQYDDPQNCYVGWQELAQKKTPTGKLVYPDIYWGMPHSGLLSWFDEKKIKIPKKDLMALMFKDRVKLAYSLKKMDIDIEGLPEIRQGEEKDREKLLEYFNYYDIVALVDRIDVLFEEDSIHV